MSLNGYKISVETVVDFQTQVATPTPHIVETTTPSIEPIVPPTEIPPAEAPVYVFENAPIIIEDPNSSSPRSFELPTTPLFSIRLISQTMFQIKVPGGRVEALANLIRDSLGVFGATSEIRDDTVVVSLTEASLKDALRITIWGCLTEYMNQIQIGIMEKTPSIATIPNEGSLMLLPAGRTVPKNKLPSQIVEIAEEAKLRDDLETIEAWSVALTIDSLFSGILSQLREANGIALVPHPESSLAEIVMFFLAISETIGVSFSRW